MRGEIIKKLLSFLSVFILFLTFVTCVSADTISDFTPVSGMVDWYEKSGSVIEATVNLPTTTQTSGTIICGNNSTMDQMGFWLQFGNSPVATDVWNVNVQVGNDADTLYNHNYPTNGGSYTVKVDCTSFPAKAYVNGSEVSSTSSNVQFIDSHLVFLQYNFPDVYTNISTSVGGGGSVLALTTIDPTDIAHLNAGVGSIGTNVKEETWLLLAWVVVIIQVLVVIGFAFRWFFKATGLKK